MVYLPKLGNIKIGGLEKGEPKRFDKIRITSTGKKGEENFEPHPNYPSPLSKLQVILPLGRNSFDVSKISFLKIEGFRFMAKDIGGSVYLFPIDPNYTNPQKPFPVFRYGKTASFEESLELKTRGILYVLPIDSPYVGAFHFKTHSANSIMEIQNAIELASSFDPKIERTVFVAEIHTKYVNLQKNEEVSYLRIVPSFKNWEYREQVLILREKIEKSYMEAVASAVDLKESAIEYFGKAAPEITVDNAYKFEGDIVNGQRTTAVQNKVVAKLQEKASIEEKKEEEGAAAATAASQKNSEDKAEQPQKPKRGRPPKKIKKDEGSQPESLSAEPKEEGAIDTEPSLFEEEEKGASTEKEADAAEVYKALSEKYNIPFKVIKSLGKYVPLEDMEKTIQECEGNAVKIIKKISSLAFED